MLVSLAWLCACSPLRVSSPSRLDSRVFRYPLKTPVAAMIAMITVIALDIASEASAGPPGTSIMSAGRGTRGFERDPRCAGVDRLEEILRERLRIDDVADLARIAARTAEALGLSEEPPREEASARILDPAFVDAFAVAVLDSTLEDEVKLRVADLAFDLLQLPRTELEAFAVSQAIPAHLPRFAAFLPR